MLNLNAMGENCSPGVSHFSTTMLGIDTRFHEADAIFSFIWSESQKFKDFISLRNEIWLNAELPFRIMGNQGTSTGGDFLWFFGIALENTR